MRYIYFPLLIFCILLTIVTDPAFAASGREEQTNADLFSQLMEHRKVVMGMVSAAMSFIGLAFYLAVRHQNKRMVLDAQNDTMRLRQINRMNGIASRKSKPVTKQQAEPKPDRSANSKRLFGKA